MTRKARGFLVTYLLLLAASVSHAQIAIVGNAQGPVLTLTRNEASQLYLGRAHSLSDGTPVKVADLPQGEVRDRFYEALTGKNPNQIRAHWSRIVFTGRALPPQEAESAAELRARIAADPALIGYLPVGEVDAGLRVLLRLP